MKKFRYFKAFSILFILSNLVYFPFLKERAVEPVIEKTSPRFGYVLGDGSGSDSKSGIRIVKDTAVVIKTPGKQFKRLPKDAAGVVVSTGKDSSILNKMIGVASKNATPAAITTAGYEGFVSTEEGVSKKVVEKMVKNRFTQEKAEMAAGRIAKVAGSKFFRRTTVGVMAGGAAYMVVQFFKDDCTFLEKISISVCIGLMAILLYSQLIRKKWMV